MKQNYILLVEMIANKNWDDASKIEQGVTEARLIVQAFTNYVNEKLENMNFKPKPKPTSTFNSFANVFRKK